MEKHFISYSCILFFIFNALRSVFKKSGYFFWNAVFPDFRLIQSVFWSIKISFKIFFVSFYLFRSIETDFRSIETDFRSIENRKWAFLKTQIWLVQTYFSKLFKTFFSLFDSARLHRDFLVVFLQISCKVSLSLSRYVYITFPFALFFSFSCIISWFLGKSNNA